jgi:DNA-binding transcriptional ArsR family regulator
MKQTNSNVVTMQQNAKEVSDLLKIMAHPERLMVLCQLNRGEVGVGQLQQGSSLSQSAFSQHLSVLRKHGLVMIRKESQQVYYSLADHRSSKIIESLEMIFCD